MSKKSFKVFIGSKAVKLDEKNYRASGGEGAVYVKDGLAYKIYHDPKRMAPVAKIRELNALNSDKILGPIDIICDHSQTPVGFTMKYVDNSVYLCKLFVKTFKDQNNVSGDNIETLIRSMRYELFNIHKCGVVVGDYNEMNFLTDSKFNIPYHIDVDSWQTKSFKATAIMETVRDRTVKFGIFNELTDWFSFAIITFQLYTGLHPFKGGRHPNYKPKEWSKRMDDNVSVFDKNVKLPPFISSFDFIPKTELDWYKSLFVNGERSEAPVTGKITKQVNVIVSGNNEFEITTIFTASDIIIQCYDLKEFFIQTTSKINTLGSNEIKIRKARKVLLAESHENTPIVAYLTDNGHIKYHHNNFISDSIADNAIASNGAVYTISNGSLIENRFEFIGKMKHLTKTVCCIYQESSQVFQGVVIQDIIGKCWLAIPFKLGSCTNTHVKELDGHRIIDAKFCGKCCFIMSEFNGKYSYHRILFNHSFSAYEISSEIDTEFHEINAVCLDNGIYMDVTNTTLRLFKDLKGSKDFTNQPIDTSMQLFKRGTEVYFITDNKLNRIKSKNS